MEMDPEGDEAVINDTMDIMRSLIQGNTMQAHGGQRTDGFSDYVGDTATE